MSRRADRLRFRRETLLMRGELQREGLRAHRRQLEGALDGVDRGIGLLRRVATPPVLLAVGVMATLLLGRGQLRRSLAGGLTLLGLVLRIRSTGRTLTQLAGEQSGVREPTDAQLVSRSR